MFFLQDCYNIMSKACKLKMVCIKKSPICGENMSDSDQFNFEMFANVLS